MEEHIVQEKQLEHPTPSAPNNLYPQLVHSSNCQMYEFLKEFVSYNKDMNRVILNQVDKPVKYIDFQYEGMRSGLHYLKVFVGLEYYVWFEIVSDSKKCIILKTKHCTGFKYERFITDVENRILRIEFKASKPIYKNRIKISVNLLN